MDFHQIDPGSSKLQKLCSLELVALLLQVAHQPYLSSLESVYESGTDVMIFKIYSPKNW
jgi:hypothetical protein